MNSEKSVDCIVAGEANVDLLLRDVPELKFGKEKTFSGMELVLGGSSSITAFNLAKLGATVTFVGVVGRDLFGDFVQQRLSSAGVDISQLRRHRTEKTGLTIWQSRRDKRAGLTYPGTIGELRKSDLGQVVMQQARHLHVGHYFLLDKLHKNAPALFRQAKQLGLTTSLDCNYDPSENWDSGIREVLRYADIFFPNEDEAKRLTGCKSAAMAARELGKLAYTVAVKLGPRGALVFSNGISFHVPGKKVRVADTTGAGDSFNAGFLSRFLRGGNIEECARAGVAAASRCVMRMGGTAAFE